MTKDQVQKALVIYRGRLMDRFGPFLKPREAPTVPGNSNHMLWMIDKVDKILASSEVDMEKVMRWLGFLQGALWCNELCSIDEMREHCRAALATTDPEFKRLFDIAVEPSPPPDPEEYQCVGCGGQCPSGVGCGRGR
jgi:hypothetical protein